MRLRFLAAAGPKRDRATLDRKLRRLPGAALVRRFDSDLLSVWTEPGTPLLKDWSGRAVAVGLMFDRSSAQRMRRLPASAKLAETVLRDCWGAYALLAEDKSSHWVLRDPSGSIPVYHGSAGGLSLYASDWDMLRLGWPGPFRPNLDAVRQWLSLPFLRTGLTGALGVTELLPGAVHEEAPEGSSERQLWSPARFAAGTSMTASFDEAAALLRDEILRTAPLLAAGEQVTLRLSGGLDSSIVAAALARGGIDVRAVTFATRAPEGDERRFAREVAGRFQIALEELIEPDLDFRLEAAAGPLRRPPNPLLQPLHRAFAGAAGTGLVMDGAGGDNVFASLNTASPAVDAFHRRGLGRAIRTLRDMASLHGCTFWEAAQAALKRTRRARGATWPMDRTFLSASASEESQPHPWLASTANVPPGSADHIRLIAGVHHFLADPGPGEPFTIHPLIAQPVVELCLRIPSWFWLAGGRDRAVARAAFRGLVPDAVLGRRGKGSLETMFIKGYMANRAELREFLVSGRLAEEGIIEASAIASYLDRREPPRDALYIRILEIASAEQWLRSFGA